MCRNGSEIESRKDEALLALRCALVIGLDSALSPSAAAGASDEELAFALAWVRSDLRAELARRLFAALLGRVTDD